MLLLLTIILGMSSILTSNPTTKATPLQTAQAAVNATGQRGPMQGDPAYSWHVYTETGSISTSYGKFDVDYDTNYYYWFAGNTYSPLASYLVRFNQLSGTYTNIYLDTNYRAYLIADNSTYIVTSTIGSGATSYLYIIKKSDLTQISCAIPAVSGATAYWVEGWDAAGDIWVGSWSSTSPDGAILKMHYSSGCTWTVYSNIVAAGDIPTQGITMGLIDGGIWYLKQGSGKLSRFDLTAHTTTDYLIDASANSFLNYFLISGVVALHDSPNGAIWMPGFGLGKIYRFDLASHAVQTTDISAAAGTLITAAAPMAVYNDQYVFLLSASHPLYAWVWDRTTTFTAANVQTLDTNTNIANFNYQSGCFDEIPSFDVFSESLILVGGVLQFGPSMVDFSLFIQASAGYSGAEGNTNYASGAGGTVGNSVANSGAGSLNYWEVYKVTVSSTINVVSMTGDVYSGSSPYEDHWAIWSDDGSGSKPGALWHDYSTTSGLGTHTISYSATMSAGIYWFGFIIGPNPYYGYVGMDTTVSTATYYVVSGQDYSAPAPDTFPTGSLQTSQHPFAIYVTYSGAPIMPGSAVAMRTQIIGNSSVSFTPTQFHVYSNATGHMRLAVFSESASMPSSLLIECPSTSVSVGWNMIAASGCTPSSYAISPSHIWLTFQIDSANMIIQVPMIDTDSYYATQTYASFPSSWNTGGSTGLTSRWSYFISGIFSSGPPPPPPPPSTRYCTVPAGTVTAHAPDPTLISWQARTGGAQAPAGCVGQQTTANDAENNWINANTYAWLTVSSGALRLNAAGYFYGTTSTYIVIRSSTQWNNSQGVVLSNIVVNGSYAWIVAASENYAKTGVQFTVVRITEALAPGQSTILSVNGTYDAAYNASSSQRSILRNVALFPTNKAWTSFSYYDGSYWQIERYQLTNVWSGTPAVTVWDYGVNSAIPEGFSVAWGNGNARPYAMESPIYFNETEGHQLVLWDFNNPTYPLSRWTTTKVSAGPVITLYDWNKIFAFYWTTDGFMGVLAYDTVYGTINEAYFQHYGFTDASGLWDLAATTNQNGGLVIIGLWSNSHVKYAISTNGGNLWDSWYYAADNANGYRTQKLSLTASMQILGSGNLEQGYFDLVTDENDLSYLQLAQFGAGSPVTTVLSSCTVTSPSTTYVTSACTVVITSGAPIIVFTGTVTDTIVYVSTIYQSSVDYVTTSISSTLAVTTTGTLYIESDLPTTIYFYAALIFVACIALCLGIERSILALIIGFNLGMAITVALDLAPYYLLIPVIIVAVIALFFSSRGTVGEG